MLDKIDCKGYIILFFLFVMVVSDIFQETILSSFPSTMDGRNMTTYGVILSGIFLILAHILIVYNLDG